jgi:flagellar motor switch protein FliN/FliY
MASDESISQEEIDSLIAGLDAEGAADGGSSASVATDAGGPPANGLSRDEQNMLIEIGNLAMGASASTLSVILGQEVGMDPPKVTEYASLTTFGEPYAGEEKFIVHFDYHKGLQFSTACIFKASDLKVLAHQMLASVMPEMAETLPAEGPMDDMALDALGEAMNQMFHAGATSVASMLSQPVEITQPKIVPYSGEALLGILPDLASDSFLSVDYEFQMESGVRMTMLQLISTQATKAQVTKVREVMPEQAPAAEPPPDPRAATAAPPQPPPGATYPAQPAAPSAMPPRSPVGGVSPMQTNPVTVQPVQFQPLDNQGSFYGEQNKNLELVMDVTLSLTVELGKTEISIKEVLELTRGSVIELDRVAGEPVDLLANGKLIAKGEVVVIEDNFGLRITSIVSPADRLRGL